ncbi:MAG: phosphoglycerate kinase [Acidobacteriota bacterium]|nr:phosphoglycerate kinase [Acidobacteriota bacterium]
MQKQTITDLDLAGKRVLIRVDFNVPIKDGVISDDTRLRASLGTIQYALAQGATLVLASHLGRPNGTPSDTLSLKPVAYRLEKLLTHPVFFSPETIGTAAIETVLEAGSGGIVLLENLRFHSGEEKNDPEFARELSLLADIFINDAFGVAHRAHASTEGIVNYLNQSAAGLLMTDELNYLGDALWKPKRPFAAVLGGAKISGKLEVVQNLLSQVDAVFIGGAMAYTFLKGRNIPIGRSLVEDELVDIAVGLMKDAEAKNVRFELPVDHVVSERFDTAVAMDTLAVGDVNIGQRLGVDIGPGTVSHYALGLRDAGTIIWNGPMGVFETPAFSTGTRGLARAVADASGVTIVGGGDSISAVRQAGVLDQITHVSTGGGAVLEFLAGKTLPGLAALPDRITSDF